MEAEAGALLGNAGTMPLGVRRFDVVSSVEIAPSSGAATYSAVPSALAARLLELANRFAAPHGAPGRGVPWKQPSRVSAPPAGSREKATTLAELLELTNTVEPSGLTATPRAPSSDGSAVHAPEAPSRPSVPSELRQPVSVTAPVAGSRLRITTAPKLVATLLPATPPTT